MRELRESYPRRFGPPLPKFLLTLGALLHRHRADRPGLEQAINKTSVENIASPGRIHYRNSKC